MYSNSKRWEGIDLGNRTAIINFQLISIFSLVPGMYLEIYGNIPITQREVDLLNIKYCLGLMGKEVVLKGPRFV